MSDEAAATTQLYMHPREAVRRLVQCGVVQGLDDAKLDALRQECWDGSEEQLEEAGLLGILSFYYETVENGVRDGFIWHADAFWQETEDAVAELNAALKLTTPLFRQVRAREKISTARKFRETVLALEMQRDDGVPKDLDAHHLSDLVVCFNAELAARDRTDRLIELDTAGEWQMFVAMDLKLARKLAIEGALPVADLESLV